MSRIRHKGRLTPVRADLTPLEIADIIYPERLEYLTKLEMLEDDDKYYIHENSVYLIEKSDHPQNDNFEVISDGDNLNFDINFYQDGCSFKEALDIAFVNKRWFSIKVMYS